MISNCTTMLDQGFCIYNTVVTHCRHAVYDDHFSYKTTCTDICAMRNYCRTIYDIYKTKFIFFELIIPSFSV